MSHDVDRFVRALNQTWVERRYDDLAAFFDDDVVLLMAGTGTTVVGVAAMVDSYRQFGAIGTVHNFEIESVELHPSGPVVIAHLRFEIDYSIASGRYRERGLEVYAVDVSGDAPRVAWRHQVPIEGDDA